MNDPVRMVNAAVRADAAAAAASAVSGLPSQLSGEQGKRQICPLPASDKPVDIAAVLQAKYDEHMRKYRDGLHWHKPYANAVEDVACALGVTLHTSTAPA